VKTLTIVSVLVLGACRLSTDSGAPRPYILGMVSGNGLSVAAGAELSEPLAVVVIDQYGLVMPDITVTWAITAGGGSISTSGGGSGTTLSTITDASGHASVTYTAGPTPGTTASITATVSSLGTLTFMETIT
jgi:hypothetical protein